MDVAQAPDLLVPPFSGEGEYTSIETFLERFGANSVGFSIVKHFHASCIDPCLLHVLDLTMD